MQEASTPSSATWFGDTPGRNEEETAFLTQLRHEASGWTVEGLSPSATWSSYLGVPLHAEVEIPGLALGWSLQLGFWTGGPWAERSGGLILHGAWGDDHPLDNHDGNDPECLTVVGVQAEPEQHATWAAQWLIRQLRRPLVREDWLRDGKPIASVWRFADTGTVLKRQGGGLRRLMRRPPDQTTKIR